MLSGYLIATGLGKVADLGEAIFAPRGIKIRGGGG